MKTGSIPTMLSVLTLVLVFSVGGTLPAQTLQLKGGQVLLAKVEDADGTGIRVQRLDNGGTLELRWEHLAPECANRIKQRYDLLGDDAGEVMVTADVVSYFLNGAPQELIGKIVDRTPTHLIVQNRGVRFRVPLGEFRNRRTVEVPVTQIYTKDEYYVQRLAEDPPGENADKHMLMAEDLMKVRDYDRAEEHLKKAEALGNSRAPTQLVGMMERLQRYKESAKERELLDQIAVLRNRGKLSDFEKGQKLIEQFAQDFPNTKLKSEFEREKLRFDQGRRRYLAGRVSETWRRLIKTVADRRVGEGDLSLTAAREYAESQMGKDIEERVAGMLRLEPEEIRELWESRLQVRALQRPEYFSYGIGSWVLGEQAIIKDTKQAETKDDQPTDTRQEREIERIARAIREARERARRARGGQGAGGGEESDEDWWNSASRNDQTSWLRSYYAENSGEMVLSGAYIRECVNCGGSGKDLIMGPSGKPEQAECFLCHGTKYIRSFRAF